MRPIYKSILTAALVSALNFNAIAADEAAEASRLLKAGQTAEALQKIDAGLMQKPKDPQLRFLKGLIQTEQNKTNEAITTFTKLTDDYPELPEPYNNLAVLYASQGQFEKARAALEMAIRTNPTYSTAHENLGDIYAKLASQAYDKALQLDSGNAGAKLKLTLVKNLVGNTAAGVNPKNVPASTPSTAAVVAAATPPTKPLLVSKPDTEVAKVEKTEKIEKAEKSDTKNKVSAAVADKNEDEIEKVVSGWAKAWSNKDVNAYLGYYAKDFQVPKGETFKSWAAERKQRIEGKGRINVKIEGPQISIDGNSAQYKFRQIYSSDRLTANSRKTLVLSKQDGKWLIKQERTGN